MRRQHDGLARTLIAIEDLATPLSEVLVARGEHLVQQIDVPVHVPQYGESQARAHARGQLLQFSLTEWPKLGPIQDLVHAGPHSRAIDAINGAVEVNVFDHR